MSLESAWKRLMTYCDGQNPYWQGADKPREHVRTDIITVNDARLEKIAALESEVARLRDLADTRLRIFEAAATEQKRLREENERLKAGFLEREDSATDWEMEARAVRQEAATALEQRDRYRDALERAKRTCTVIYKHIDEDRESKAMKVVGELSRRIEEVLRDG